MVLIKALAYLLQCGFRLAKLIIALTFRCVSSWCCVNSNQSNQSNQTNSSSSSNSSNTDSIAKLDLIEALDIEIESLAQEKQFYEQQLNTIAVSNKLSTEKQLKAQHKVVQLNTRIMTLTRRVLKLREELENDKTSI